MLNKLYIFLGAAVIIIAIWLVVVAFQSASPRISTGLFQTDFLTSISRQVTSGLSFGTETSVPEVSLEELGEISPLAGMVTIEKDVLAIRDSAVANEYITISAHRRNANPINISNWSLQSMISDTWIGLPQGASTYVAGSVNEIGDIYLAPGESAVVATAASPVGVSFKVNACSGYLGSTQTFTPRLTSECVAPRAVVPPTVENIKLYGDACMQIVDNLPRCTYITNHIHGFANISSACKAEIQPRFTYNGCVGDMETNKDFFAAKEWRIFLNQPRRAWKDSYEVIRLLDDQNRTVDVFSY